MPEEEDGVTDGDDPSQDPALSLLNKLLWNVAEKEDASPSQSPSDSYLWLLQDAQASLLHPKSRSTTVSAGARSLNDGVDSDASVYHRAGLATPQELAQRHIQASCHNLWMRHLCTNVSRLEAATRTTTKDSSANCYHVTPRVVWLNTTPKKRPRWLERLQTSTTHNIHSNKETFRNNNWFSVIDCCEGAASGNSGDPWGWGQRTDKDESTSLATSTHNINMGDMARFTRQVHDHIKGLQSPSEKTTPKVVVFVDSVTPLIQAHGARATLKFLQGLPVTVTVVSTSSAALFTSRNSNTNHMLMKWQDAAQAVLLVDDQSGSCNNRATLVRQGVRERGNVVRQEWEYRIMVARTRNNNTNNNGKTEDECQLEMILPTSTTNHAAIGAYSTTDDLINPETGKDGQPVGGGSGGRIPHRRREKIKLKLEDDDDDARADAKQHAAPLSATTVAAAASIATPQQQQQSPFIIVDDNDPEYQDYDEEDPDDDLDI